MNESIIIICEKGPNVKHLIRNDHRPFVIYFRNNFHADFLCIIVSTAVIFITYLLSLYQTLVIIFFFACIYVTFMVTIRRLSKLIFTNFLRYS